MLHIVRNKYTLPKYYTYDSRNKFGCAVARLPRLIFLKLRCWKEKRSKYPKEEGPFFGGYAYTCDDADYGEMIMVHDGTYIENINFKGKVITLFLRMSRLPPLSMGVQVAE